VRDPRPVGDDAGRPAPERLLVEVRHLVGYAQQPVITACDPPGDDTDNREAFERATIGIRESFYTSVTFLQVPVEVPGDHAGTQASIGFSMAIRLPLT
jgi:hypothetical protein